MEQSAAATPTADDILREVGRPKPTGLRRLARNVGLGAAGLLVIAGGVVAKMSASAPPPPNYLTAKVERGDLSATVTATGNLRGKDTTTVGAEISGRVARVFVDFDDPVKAGQVLAEIDPERLDAELAQATAQLAAARADAKSAEATATEAELAAKRTRELAARGLVSAQELEAANAAAARAVATKESAAAKVLVAEATVKSGRTNLEKATIESPIDGVVLARNVEVGQTLAATMTAPVLFTIARDLRSMEVTLAIDEADVGRTKPGQRATFTVDAWPGRTFEGRLVAVHNVATTKDNVVTYEARVDVANDERLLRPGMTATVVIHTDARVGVLTVPNAALRFSPPAERKSSLLPPPPDQAAAVSDGKQRVWVLAHAGPSERVVETRLTDGVRTEVVARDLSAGDVVILDVEQEVKP